MSPSAAASLRALGLAIGYVLAAWPLQSAAAGTAAGHLAATTDYVFRGVSQTRGGPAIQGDLHYLSPAGWVIGAFVSTIDPNPGPGATVELNAYAGRNWSIGESWSARVTAVHYAYPNDTASLHYDYDELVASLGYRDRLAATVAWSPNTSLFAGYRYAENRTAFTYDLVGRWPLYGPLVATGSVGYYDLEDLFDSGYGYWSAGLSLTMTRLQFDIAYYTTADVAESWFGAESAGSRWSLVAAWRF